MGVELNLQETGLVLWERSEQSPQLRGVSNAVINAEAILTGVVSSEVVELIEEGLSSICILVRTAFSLNACWY
jgi:hypothetical protein